MAAPKLRCHKCWSLLVTAADAPDAVRCLDCGHEWNSVHALRDQHSWFALLNELPPRCPMHACGSCGTEVPATRKFCYACDGEPAPVDLNDDIALPPELRWRREHTNDFLPTLP